MRQIFAFLLLLLVALDSRAASYFVTQSGAGAHNGTSSGNAWSVSEYNASGTPTGGDTVSFSGTITSQVTIGTSGTSNAARLTLDFSGATLSMSGGNRIVCSNHAFININGGTMTGEADGVSFNDALTSHDITIQNWTWTAGSTSTAQLVHLGYCYNLLIANNTLTSVRCLVLGDKLMNHDITIRNNFVSTSLNTTDQTDIVFIGDAANVTIEGNKFVHNTVGATSVRHNDVIQCYRNGGSNAAYPTNWIIRYNWIELNVGGGGSGDNSWLMLENMDGNPACQIYSNVFLGRNGTAGNNGMSPNGNQSTSVWYLYNNTIVRHGGPDNVSRFLSPGTLIAKNNIGYDPSGGGGTYIQWTMTEGESGNGWNYNRFWNWTGTTSAAGANGSTSSNPLFVDGDGPTYNFETQTSSPARNAGTSTIGSTYNQGIAFGATWPNPALATRTASSWDVGAFQAASGPDTTPPTLTSATITSGGATMVLLFNENVVPTISTGWTTSLSGGSATLTYLSGTGTNTLTYTISRVVSILETGTVSYAQPGNGIEDIALNDLASITARAVINNSTQGQTAAVSMSIPGGSYYGAQTVTLTSSTPGSTIFYTTDGSTPTASSSVYSSPLVLSAGTTLKAFARASGLVDSGITTAIYEIGTWVTTDGAWKTFAVPQQTGTFTWTFDATPSASGMDIIIGAGPGVVSSPTGMGPIMAFEISPSVIDARNGGTYSAVNVFNYSPGNTYHFVLTVNVTNRTYSATVAQSGGGSTVVIANNYAFRTEQASVTELDNIGIIGTGGTVTVSGMSFGGVTSIPSLNTATIGSSGTTLTLGFSESVVYGLGGNGGWTINASGGAATLAPAATPASFTVSRVIAIGEIGTISYTQPGNGVEASSGGGDLATLSGFSFNNQSSVDIAAPVPNPMTFSTQPSAPTSFSATMTASLATDSSTPPVQYYFDETSGNAGGTDSGWQSSRTYTNNGLSPGIQYTYRVLARDSATTPNQTSPSSSFNVTTPIIAGGRVITPAKTVGAGFLNP